MRVGFMVVALLTFNGCDYTERFAGGELKGEVLPTPSDWGFSDRTMLVQLETNPENPYSVNIWGVGIDSNYYVAAGQASEAAWAIRIETNSAVKLRIGNTIYLLEANRVTDMNELSSVAVAFEKKYGGSQREWVNSAWVYRLTSRSDSNKS